jgi:Tfp pilus assembly protein PilN
MIEVNLAPGPRRKKAAGGAGGISLGELKAVLARVKDPLLVGAAAAWVVGLVFVGLLYTADTRRRASLEADLSRMQAEQRRFSALIAQKRQAEQLRDSLVTELGAIRNIDAERYVWPHILEEVTRALPDFTWLVSVDPLGPGSDNGAAPAAGPDAGNGTLRDPAAFRTVRVQIDGRTSDIQAYTRFLRQLANSPWIAGVVAGPTTTAIEQARPVTAFSLTAAFRPADSAYIRTAPVTETLR